MSAQYERVAKTRSRWTMPAFFLGIGVVSLVTAAVGERLVLGLVTLGIMVVCGAIVAAAGPVDLASRTRTGRTGGAVPRGRVAFGVIAALVTVAILGAFFATLAAGGSGYPWFWLVVALAVVYVVFAISRRRA